MIDTHCHLLPGIDDGPKSQAESLELAGRLVADGVDFVLCTPHYSRGFPTAHADALARAQSLSAALDAVGLVLRTGVAAEVSAAFSLTADIEELAARSIAGRFVLVELEPATTAPLVGSICGRLARAELLPILAHPERCRAVQRHRNVLDSARADGALVQVVAPSLIGRWGEDVEAMAWWLVDTGRVDLLASDAHGRRSPPALARAAELIAERLGEGVSLALTERRPGYVIEGVHPAERP